MEGDERRGSEVLCIRSGWDRKEDSIEKNYEAWGMDQQCLFSHPEAQWAETISLRLGERKQNATASVMC